MELDEDLSGTGRLNLGFWHPNWVRTPFSLEKDYSLRSTVMGSTREARSGATHADLMEMHEQVFDGLG